MGGARLAMLGAICVVVAVCVSGFSPSRSAALTHAGLLPSGVRLSVTPIPTLSHPSVGTPMVTWSTGDGSPGLVTVATIGTRETLFAEAPDGTEAAPWIAPGRVYVFRLYSIVSGRRLLARLAVGRASAAQIVAAPPHPRITSPLVDRLLQLLSFAALCLLGVLGVLYVRELRRDA